MDFVYDEQQLAFGAAVRELAAGPLAGAAREAYEADGDDLPDKVWSTIAAQGWLAVLVGEDAGGLGLGLVEAQLVARGVGAGTLPGPWRAAVLALEAVRLGGGSAALVEALASGEQIGTHALEQPVTFTGDTATGRVTRVEYANAADVLVLRDADGALAYHNVSDPGVTLIATPQSDRSTRLFTVELLDAPITRLPDATVDDLLPRAAVLTAGELVGIAREAHRRTVDYDKQRVQFGVPVGSFQALKHALADLHVGITMAEAAVMYAAFALDAGLDDAELAVAVAKAKASSTALEATAAMIQFHGGIGFTWEHDAHFYFKRARRLAPEFGDVAVNRERVASLLLDA